MLQTNYMYVLGKIWGLNCTTGQMICWKVVQIFIDAETAQKISFHSESNPAALVSCFHPSQLEKRFGGQAESPKQFWPPIIPS